MKREFRFGVSIVFLFFIFLFLFSSFVSATCSIGATPLEMVAKVKPGTTVEVDWNFYNLYGDRTTHITVTKISGPDWKITYNPALHNASYEISGVIENRTENLAIENSSVVITIPANVPNDTLYVKHPNKDGYILTKPIKIYITVPESAKLGQIYNFTFQGKGDCYTGPGTVIPGVATQLKVSITATNDVLFSEKPVSNNNGGTGTGFSIFGTGTATSILIITGIIFIIVIFFLLGRGMGKSAREKKQSNAGSVNTTMVDNKPSGDDKGMPGISFSSS